MDTLLIDHSETNPGLTTITLNRPDKLNAINNQVHLDLQAACAELREDLVTRVVIFTGAGRAFTAGADLGPQGPRTPAAAPTPVDDVLAARYASGIGNRTCDAIEGLDQVTIGAINGLTIGGGVVFTSCFDLRLAAQSAWFSIPEVDLNLPLTWDALPRLMRELGPARTKELVLTCDRFSAEDAERWGLVNHVVPDDELVDRARELAAQLLEKNALAVALTKSTTRALQRLMVPAEATHSDADYLLLSRLLRATAGADPDAAR
jgi:enoyl-CoA hydratase/carnithine racemase